MKPKKEMIIVIPGSKYLSSPLKPIESLIVFLYSLVNISNPIHTNYAKKYVKAFKQKNRKIIFLNWNQGFTPFSVLFSGRRKLKQLIDKYKDDYQIILIGLSLGGEIALKTAKKFDDKTIDKIILICSTNTNKKISFKNIKIINIYSVYDLFVRISTKILAPIHGGIELKGKNTINIPIKDFGHDDFCRNKKIKSGKYKDKTITQLIKSFL